jgi:hypothetical protein
MMPTLTAEFMVKTKSTVQQLQSDDANPNTAEFNGEKSC